MKYKDILVQIETLKKKADKARKTELGKAIAEIKARMKASGVTLADLRDAPSARKSAAKSPGSKAASKAGKKVVARRKVAAKYRDPASGAEWSGRGRQPRWLAAAVAKGAKQDSFLIKR